MRVEIPQLTRLSSLWSLHHYKVSGVSSSTSNVDRFIVKIAENTKLFPENNENATRNIDQVGQRDSVLSSVHTAL